jgi:aminoglycoside/choline kinase family phosphotransferase
LCTSFRPQVGVYGSLRDKKVVGVFVRFVRRFTLDTSK